MAIPSSDSKTRDYLDGITLDNRPSDRIVEQYLEYCSKNGLTCGRSSAGNIRNFMRIHGIDIPSAKPIQWINYQVRDAIRGGLDNYDIVEIAGIGNGMVFAWWYKWTGSSESQ